MPADDPIPDVPLEDDDLFDFDELIEQSEDVAEELSAELDEALTEMEPPSPAGETDFAAVIAPAIAPISAPAPQRESPARGLKPHLAVAALIVLGFANLSLVGLTWKSLDTTRELVANASIQGGGPIGSSVDPKGLTDGGLAFPPTSLGGPRPEGRAMLAAAGRAIEAGELGRARRSVHGLLAVIDRVRPSEREDIEARASFLIAETYRLEARRLGREVPR